MTPRLYRKKPVVIEAIQLTEETAMVIAQWLVFYGQPHKIGWDTKDGARVNYIKIPTLEGTMKAVIGDYIIRGIKGEFYPCKPDVFEQTYELVKEAGDERQDPGFQPQRG
jgi:hypothetical protein